MTNIILKIPRVPVTVNVTRNWHWARRGRYADDWHREVYYALVSQYGQLLEIPGKRSMTIIQSRQRLLDPDNLVASCKPIIDACRKVGLIHDDSEKWLSLEVDQVKGKPETLITIFAA